MEHGLHIYLIDDEAAALRAMELSLKTAGFHNIQSAESWESARTLLDPSIHAIALLDIDMPHTSGINALLELKKDFPNCKTIMMTGIKDLQTAVLAMKRGAVDYLTKPIDKDVLIHTINSVIIDSHFSPPSPSNRQNQRPSKNLQEFQLLLQAFLPEQLQNTLCNCKRTQDEDFPTELCQQLAHYLQNPENYTRHKLTLQDIARDLGTNTSYLSRIINQSCNMNFRSLLNRIRLASALQAALNGALNTVTVEGLAHSVGFSQKTTFYAAFRAISSRSPKDIFSQIQSAE